MVRKIKLAKKENKEDTNVLNTKTYMKMLTDIGDVNKMNDFLGNLKEIQDDDLKSKSIEELLEILPESVKEQFMSIITGAGIGKLTDKQKSIFIAQNYNMIKDMLIDMLMSFKMESPETVQMEKEFTESFEKFQEEYAKVKEIQYDFCKTLRRQRILKTEAILTKTHDVTAIRSLNKAIKMMKSIEDYRLLSDSIECEVSKSQILQLCVNEEGTYPLSHLQVIAVGSQATTLLVNALITSKEKFHDPREFCSVMYFKLFEPSPENMEIITYFWLGYVNAILRKPMDTLLRTFVLETSLNWIFLAKDEIPEEDKNEMRDNIIEVADKVKKTINGAREYKKETEGEKATLQ